MQGVAYPIPASHRVFKMGKVVIDSCFDNGNCSFAERIGSSSFAIWIGADHPKNAYRMWFHFRIEGISRGTSITFQIKNMQNCYRLLEEGLRPVFMDEATGSWKRVSHKVDMSKVNVQDNQMQWSFTHTFASSQKHSFALFYPWSNLQNSLFLERIDSKLDGREDIFYQRAKAIESLEGRPVEMLTLTSMKGVTNRQHTFGDSILFQEEKAKPRVIEGEKKCVIVSARVHPGQVPGSHTMCGVIDFLTSDDPLATVLRDRYIFYIFPILNPDGVARGHMRVDTNGINLNRCYINPSPKDHPSIYAVKKVIMYCHGMGKYLAFLDLHAQASRKGNFIYGNASNQLSKQVEACLFPKILSLNSQNFEYEGSNFMEKHMHQRDRGDHVSKQGCGRVAVFHATKNPNSWTVQCSYNISQKVNILHPHRSSFEQVPSIDEDKIDRQLIRSYKNLPCQDPKEYFTIETYRQLGRDLMESLLDFEEAHPYSRIDNPTSYFKNVSNIRLNLAIGLLRMSPNRFEPHYRKIYYLTEGNCTEANATRCYQALYYLLVKKAKIPNLMEYLRGDKGTVLLGKKGLENVQLRRSTVVKPGSKIESPTANYKRTKSRPTQEGESYLDLRTTNSVMCTTSSSPDKDGRRGWLAPASSGKRSGATIKIVSIDKEIFAQRKQQTQTKKEEEFKMVGINSIPQKTESHSQQNITNYRAYKKQHSVTLGKPRQASNRRSTYHDLFKLQVLPKILPSQKALGCFTGALLGK